MELIIDESIDRYVDFDRYRSNRYFDILGSIDNRYYRYSQVRKYRFEKKYFFENVKVEKDSLESIIEESIDRYVDLDIYRSNRYFDILCIIDNRYYRYSKVRKYRF